MKWTSSINRRFVKVHFLEKVCKNGANYFIHSYYETKMSTANEGNDPGSSDDDLSQPWFQLFWKIATGLLAVMLIALIYKTWQYCKFRKKLDNITALSSQGPTESMIISNQEALRMWGTTPGVIVTGRTADNVYHPADGLGQFGSSNTHEIIPELEHATTQDLDQNLIIATRASESNMGADEVVLEAIPYSSTRRE